MKLQPPTNKILLDPRSPTRQYCGVIVEQCKVVDVAHIRRPQDLETSHETVECREATYTKERTQHLRRANLGIEKLRFLLRLAADLRLLDRRRYEHAARTLDDTGRLIGGWMKVHTASIGEAVGEKNSATP